MAAQLAWQRKGRWAEEKGRQALPLRPQPLPGFLWLGQYTILYSVYIVVKEVLCWSDEPEACATPDIRRLPVALDIAIAGIVLHHQRPRQQPGGIKGDQQADSVSVLGEVGVHESQGRFLNVRVEWLDS